MLEPLGAGPQPTGTAGLLRRALAAAAQTAGKSPMELSDGIGTKLVVDADKLTELIATREGEERELVAWMQAERGRAAAAAVATR